MLPTDLERALQERQRIELARVPNHALSCCRTEERQHDVFEIERIGEAFLERILRGPTAALETRKERRFLHSQANVERNSEQKKREKEWNSPAVGTEASFTKEHARRADDTHAEKEPERCG